ncbi:MAG: YciI family protein [Actinomycetota bacterium]|nr:YciI family protein [Actinomycetota bacterium]
MKYLLTIYGDESGFETMTPEQGKELMDAYGAFGAEIEAAGVYVGGEGLQPSATATTVRVRDGERLLTDGPFAETKEQLGGYYLLDCEDLDEAIGWAAKIPGVFQGAVEVRPVMDYEAMGASGDHPASREAAH